MKSVKTLCLVLAVLVLFLASPVLFSRFPVSPSIAHAQDLTDLPIVGGAFNWVEDTISGAVSGIVDFGATQLEGFVGRVMAIVPQWALRWICCDVPGVTVALNTSPEALQRSAQISMIGALGRSITGMYTYPPASTYAFLMDTGQSLGFVPKKAYAQGVGFAGLAPVLPLWKVFRNVAYFAMAIVMIVIGFMVMFRKKIDPRTVVTVQNALPRIVITLILITFSYAIVALMIDFMYLLIILGITVIGQSGLMPPGASALFSQIFTSGGFFEVLGTVFLSGMTGAGRAALGVSPTAGGIAALAPIGIGLISGLAIMVIGSGGTAAIVIGIGVILLGLLLVFVLLFAVFRIFFMLLMAYINIMVALIFGPIQIMFDAFPGGNGFNGWIRNVAANVLVFPVTAFMLTLSTVFAFTSAQGNLWTPPMLAMPVVGAPGANNIMGFLALGFLLLTPTIANGLKEALKPSEYKYGGAPGQAIGAVFGFPVGMATGMAQTGFTHWMMTSSMRSTAKAPAQTPTPKKSGNP